MAGTLDLDKTYATLAAIDQRKAFIPEQFFSSQIFHLSESIAGEEVVVDIIKGTRRVAPIVHWQQEAPVVNPTIFKTSKIAPPYIKERHTITAQDIKKRMPGENFVRKNFSPAQMRAQLEGERVQDSINAVHRRRELMCSRALHTGKIPIVGKGFNAEIDFLRDADHTITLTGGDLWTASDSDPLKDLSTWKSWIAEKTGYSLSVVLFGFKAHWAFISNPQVKEYLNIWNMAIAKVDMTNLAAKGLSKFCDYDGMSLYTYNDWYKDPDTGLSTPMVETNKVLGMCPDAQNTSHYAQIMDIEADDAGMQTHQFPIFPKFWMTQDPSAENILVQSAPIPLLNEPDTTFCAEVCAS